MLFVSHGLAVVLYIDDRVAVMNVGSIVELKSAAYIYTPILSNFVMLSQYLILQSG
jgi:ABC-type oligopeptide transport system ATPase subunit